MDSKLIDAITYGFNTFVENRGDISQLCDNMLSKLLEMTDSEYGVISEYRETPSPHIHHHAITNISWNDDSRKLYDQLKDHNFDFYGRNTLFSLITQGKKLIISNDPYNDLRRGGKSKLPFKHPRINNFAGIPLYFEHRLIGVVGLANHDGGYTKEFINQFNPFMTAISYIMGEHIVALKLQQKNDKEKEFLQEIANAKSKIWAMISHDIRSPLNEIIGTSMLLDTTALNSQQKEYIKIISSCSNHLSNFINEILDYSKCSVGKMILNNELFSLEQCIEECYDVINTRASEKDISLSFYVDNNVPSMIISDIKRVKQILINILTNAVKFTDFGSIVTNVTLNNITSDKCDITFSTTDTGIGIAENNLNKIFESFNQIHNKNNKEYEGTGLGLFICKEMVKLFNGDVSVTSKISEGSTFTFNIVVEYVKPKKFDSKIQNVKILIVDESERNRMTYLKMFTEWGMQPQLCNSGHEALEYLKVYKFDLLFTDSRIKGMDCIELSLNAKKIYGTIKLMVSTSIIERYPKDKFDIQLTRPISSSKLYDTISNLLK